MSDPTPDEAAASLQAVLDTLDQGGRHCGCDPYLYEDTDFIGIVSDAQGRNHREVHGATIRTLLAERDQLRAQHDEIAGRLPIEELALDMRPYNILKAAGIRHIGEITRRTEAELYQLHNMGKISMRNIKDRLRDEFGLTLRQDDDDD